MDLAALTAAQGYKMVGAAAGDWFGSDIVNLGDVNGDGVPDCAVGAPLASTGGSRSGNTYIVYGQSSQAVIDMANLGSAGVKIQGIPSMDWSGWLLTAPGDVTGDGVPDLMIGAPYASPGYRLTSGRYYVVPGNVTGMVDLRTYTGALRIEGPSRSPTWAASRAPAWAT